MGKRDFKALWFDMDVNDCYNITNRLKAPPSFLEMIGETEDEATIACMCISYIYKYIHHNIIQTSVS